MHKGMGRKKRITMPAISSTSHGKMMTALSLKILMNEKISEGAIMTGTSPGLRIITYVLPPIMMIPGIAG